MGMILFWLVPLILAAAGFQRLTYRAFSKFICVIFAAYIGMWSEPMFSRLFGLFLPKDAHALRSMIAVYAVTLVVFVALLWMINAMNPRGNFYQFPKGIDQAGGVLFGWLTGFVLINFVMVAACLTPLKNDLPLGLNVETMQPKAVDNFMTVTGLVNAFSLQPRNNAPSRAHLKELLTVSDEAALEYEYKKAVSAAVKRGEKAEDVERPPALTTIRQQRDERNRELEK